MVVHDGPARQGGSKVTTQPTRYCEYCGKPYRQRRKEASYHFRERRYCSRECGVRGRTGKPRYGTKPVDLANVSREDKVKFALMLHFLDALDDRCKEMGVKVDVEGFLPAVVPEIRRVLTGPGRVRGQVMEWQERVGQGLVYMPAHNYARARRDVGLRVI
jgi:hypothetical protein